MKRRTARAGAGDNIIILYDEYLTLYIIIIYVFGVYACVLYTCIIIIIVNVVYFYVI